MFLVDLDKLDKNVTIVKNSEGKWFECYDGVGCELLPINVNLKFIKQFILDVDSILLNSSPEEVLEFIFPNRKNKLTEGDKLSLGMC